MKKTATEVRAEVMTVAQVMTEAAESKEATGAEMEAARVGSEVKQASTRVKLMVVAQREMRPRWRRG